MRKEFGILILLVVVCLATSIAAPRFCLEYNLQNLLQRTALFAILSIGVAFVIITGGIDLSIGSVVGLVGALMPLLLVEQGWSVGATLAFVMGVSLLIGLLHGLLVTRVGLQPFVVTLCGLLVYRGLARWVSEDRVRGFGREYDDGIRQLAIDRPFEIPLPGTKWIAEGNWGPVKIHPRSGDIVLDQTGQPVELDFWAWIEVPLPFLIMLGIAILAAVFLNLTVWGRYLLALGRSEEAARYSGIRTGPMTVIAYVLCSGLAGIGGILFALDVNLVQPAAHGNFYELYAIAAAVLGGCSLRGGQGSILGVIIGAALMRVLYNSINLLGIPTQLEFAIIGFVILAGVTGDEVVRRLVARRRRS